MLFPHDRYDITGALLFPPVRVETPPRTKKTLKNDARFTIFAHHSFCIISYLRFLNLLSFFSHVL